MHLINIIDDDFKYNMVLMNTSSEGSMFMLPLKEDGKLLFEQFVFQLADLLFVNATLSDLEMISNEIRREVVFTLVGEVLDINVLRRLQLKMEYYFDSTKNISSLYWKNLTDSNLKKVIESTTKFFKAKEIVQYKMIILPQKKQI